MYTITLEDTGETFGCRADQNVLAAMERLGRRGIPVGCRGGGCGVCRVQVLGAGRYHTLKMSRQQISEDDEQAGICLACKLIPDGDLNLKALGRLESKLTRFAHEPVSRA